MALEYDTFPHLDQVLDTDSLDYSKYVDVWLREADAFVEKDWGKFYG